MPARTDPEPKLVLHRHRLAVSALAGIMVVAAFAMYTSGQAAEARAAIAEDTWAGGAAVRAEWREFLRAEATGLSGLDKVWNVSGGMPPDDVIRLTATTLGNSKGITGLAVAHPDGTLGWLRVPDDATREAPRVVPAAWAPTVAAAATHRTVVISPLLTLPGTDEPGFLLAKAVQVKEDGTATVVVAELPLERALSGAFGPTTTRQFALTFVDPSGLRAAAGGDPAEDAPQARVTLEPPAWVVRSADPTALPTMEVAASENAYHEVQGPTRAYILGIGLVAGVVTAGGTWRELGRQAERAEAGRRVALSEAHYRDLFERAGELILLLDRDGRIRRANRQAERALGAPDGGLVGRSVPELAAPGETRQVAERLHEVLNKGGDATFEATLVGADGRRVDVYGTLTAGDEGLRAYLADVTALRRLEARLRLANQSLSEKLAELDSFAYTVAHDLKNPLRGVSAYAEFLEEDYGEHIPDEGKEYVTQIRAGTDRMRDMVEALLRYARAGSTQYPLERMRAGDAVHDATEDLRSLLRERHATVHVADDLPEITAQRVPLKQVFQNLLANAVKYNDKDTPEIHVSARRDGDGAWEFTVADNGPGILEAERERLFDLFHRSSGTTAPGTGVGLAIVKRIVEAHGGHAWADNRPGGGAAFRFTIPEEANAAPEA